MKIILVGYSKTGTKTMTNAFRLLGYETYDAVENYFFLYAGWNKIFKGQATTQDIRHIFDGVDALSDIPVFAYWKELAEAFPEAKIILTTRDEESWYKSLINQFRVLNGDWLRWFAGIFSPLCWIRASYQKDMYKTFGDLSYFPSNTLKVYPEAVLKKQYRKHNEDVLNNTPKERLLVYNVSEGWKPLCEFLGDEIPDLNFPHKNKGGEFVKQLASTTFAFKVLGSAVITFSGLVVGVAYLTNKLMNVVYR